MAKKRPRVVNTEKPKLYIYPFEELGVDESFKVTDMSKWNSLRAAASRKGSQLGRTFKVKKLDTHLLVTRTD